MTFKATRGCMEISHLAYADDIVIFTQAAETPLRRLRACLDEYAEISGQQINLAKSNFYVAEKHERCADLIQTEGGFSRGTFPFLYLGVPIYRGIKRTDMFMFLRDKIAARVTGWAHRHLSFGGRLTLIKSTLEAVPLHIFQAIEPTSGALKQLDQQMARFFWGSTSEKKKTHWIGWDQICLPTFEGGLGVRKSKEVLRSFNIKLWWRFREQNSLWARYMKMKYCKKASPLASNLSGHHSPTWKRLMRARHQANLHIRWVVGEGEIYFWDDIWVGNSALRNISLDDRGAHTSLVKDYLTEGVWNEAKLQQLHDQAGLPQQVISQILDTPVIAGEPDLPRWSLSRLGEFSLATTWDTLRTHRPRIQGLEDIWRASMTNSIAIFNWRLLSNRIPVDTKLQWRKIDLASKCQCCPRRPNIESLQHLFIQGWGASCVWREFDGWFGGSSPPLRINDTIPDRLEVWSQRTQQEDRKHLCRVMPYLILWFIWAERNRSRHELIQFKPFNVVWQVQMHIHNNIVNGTIKPKHWKGVHLGISIPSQPSPRGSRPFVMPVKWHPPEDPWIKVNTDGAYKETTDSAGGGGVVRDRSGKLIMAFSTPLDAHSALEAELMAAHHGLELAKELGQPIWIETDAEQVTKLLNGKLWGPANVRRAMARLFLFKRQHDIRVSSIPREGNQAADLLAKMGMGQQSFLRFSAQTAPTSLKDIIRMEKMGLPNIRVRSEDHE